MNKELAKWIETLVNAGFAGIWVQTQEADEAQRTVVRLCSHKEWKVSAWDCVQGLYQPQNPTAAKEANSADPRSPLRVPVMEDEGRHLVLLHNYHRFLENPIVVQAVSNAILRGKGTGVHFLILSPVVMLPIELEKLFSVVVHPLPTPNQLRDIANDLNEKPTGTPVDPGVLTAALGLTRREAENAFSLSLCETADGSLDPDIVWSVKIQSVAKEKIGKISLPKRGLSCVGGYDHYKELCSLATRPGNPFTPKGDILVSPAGVGKTTLAKALAAEWSVPLIEADLGSMKDSKVGGSEKNIRGFIDLCEAIGQGLGEKEGRRVAAVVLLDEIEKSLAGAGDDRSNDSGVSTDQLGTLLRWRQDSEAPIFVVGTCNDASTLSRMSNGALIREDRFDGLVFLDLPNKEEREAIWQIHLKAFNLNAVPGIDDVNFTGAMIKGACKKARMWDLPLQEAIGYVTPCDMAEVNKLRDWAKGRCRSASYPGLYRGPETGADNLSSSSSRRQLTIKKGAL